MPNFRTFHPKRKDRKEERLMPLIMATFFGSAGSVQNNSPIDNNKHLPLNIPLAYIRFPLNTFVTVINVDKAFIKKMFHL